MKTVKMLCSMKCQRQQKKIFTMLSKFHQKHRWYMLSNVYNQMNWNTSVYLRWLEQSMSTIYIEKSKFQTTILLLIFQLHKGCSTHHGLAPVDTTVFMRSEIKASMFNLLSIPILFGITTEEVIILRWNLSVQKLEQIPCMMF